MPGTLAETPLVPAAVKPGASFAEAARALCEHGISAIAVLDVHERVVGLFTEDDLLEGLFPGYLRELRHTAFLGESIDALLRRAREAADEPVTQHMHAPITVDAHTGAAHVAERFLHCEWGALAVVEGGRFLGMVTQVAFCRTLLRRIDGKPAE
jgi:CBS domain-containing protein